MFTRLGYFARETLISLRRNLLMTIAGVLTVTVSLSLFGGIFLLSKWVDHGTEVIKGGVRLEAFMLVDATDRQITDLRKQLEGDKQIKSIRYLDKDAAYAEFKRIFRNDPDLVSNVDAASLPVSFRIAPVRAEDTKAIQRRYEVGAGVDKVVQPDDALRGILSATSTVKWILWGLSAVLLVSSLFLIVNTIRLATYARRREIEVMKLVGASNWFVRVPFMAEGLMQGVLGAGMAVGAVASLKFFGFDNWFQSRDNFFNAFYVTGPDAVLVCVVVLVLGVIIGLFASLIGLRRFLRV